MPLANFSKLAKKLNLNPAEGEIVREKKWKSKKVLQLTPSSGLIQHKMTICLFFFFFPENRIWHSMQIVSMGHNLHEILNPVF